MKGFDKKYKDFPDYILGITNEIWEQRGIEKLYDDIGLSGFDSELLGWYYDEWIVVMRNWSRP